MNVERPVLAEPRVVRYGLWTMNTPEKGLIKTVTSIEVWKGWAPWPSLP